MGQGGLSVTRMPYPGRRREAGVRASAPGSWFLVPGFARAPDLFGIGEDASIYSG